MKINFTKMQGAGNDYIYVDCFAQDVRLSAQQIAFLSDRRFGVGGDGVIFIRPSERADGFMDMYNLDGSFGMMCGNGVRCVGKYLFDHGYAKSETVRVDTRSGIKTLHMTVGPDGKALGAAVEMGKAELRCASIPVAWDGENLDVPVRLQTPQGEQIVHATCVSMGNPHAVVFTERIDALDLESIGPLYECNPLFPDRVNTEFIEVLSPTELRMRVWERGSGETLACGTGACAAAVASVLKGYCSYETPVTVHLRGGDLKITYAKDGSVLMQGPAVEVFSGQIEL